MITIIDGISNVSKTTFLKKIKGNIIKEKYKFSQIFISEHLTERFFENKQINDVIIEKHILNILKGIKSFNDVYKSSPFVEKDIFSVYIERLFLTFYSKGLLKEDFLIRNIELISNLDICNILLCINKKNLKVRLENTIKERNDNWKKYIDDLGGIDVFEDILLKQQGKMIKFNDEVLRKYVKTEVFNTDNINNYKLNWRT